MDSNIRRKPNPTIGKQMTRVRVLTYGNVLVKEYDGNVPRINEDLDIANSMYYVHKVVYRDAPRSLVDVYVYESGGTFSSVVPPYVPSEALIPAPVPEVIPEQQFYIDCDNDGQLYVIDCAYCEQYEAWMEEKVNNEDDDTIPHYMKEISDLRSVAFTEHTTRHIPTGEDNGTN